MNYTVKLADGTPQLVDIKDGYFKNWKVWIVNINGKAAMLYKLGTEWMQRNEDFLDSRTLKIIGEFIDTIISPQGTPSLA
ncbi:hypothetical protein [Mucilaginibacter sp. dw_454]|uniref:hypothetical protein n=1 Tax=Mucilaginibacter sp. dw_454 TaxID=2720079 RepID=UPI001BD2AB4D|nr:hypothetical protein [Mucilaginibacter sp. dw_454]